MRREDSYWGRRVDRNRFSRRRFVGGVAAAGVGAASLGLVGCGDDGGGSATAPAGSPTPVPGPRKGGIHRRTDPAPAVTFDIDRSDDQWLAYLMGWTNLGIVQYKSFEKGELEGAFAEKYEQPDAQTLVLKLRQNLAWHDKPPVNGRAARAEDMKFYLERNKAGKAGGVDDPNFQRKPAFANIDTVSVTDPSTLTVKFSKPTPLFLTTLAAPLFKVQAPEAVAAFEKDYASLRAELIIGTGPYVLKEIRAAGFMKFRRFDKFAMGEPLLDGIDTVAVPPDEATLQTSFEQKQVDSYEPKTAPVLNDLLKRYDKQLAKTSYFQSNPMGGYYNGPGTPWNNRNVIGAIFRTIDRRLLIQQLFQGSGALAGPTPPFQSAFGISDKELATFPGYLEDHSKDLAEAKKMWDAGGGPALGEIVIDIPDIWEAAYNGAGASIAKMLHDNLGNKFTAKNEPYSTIIPKLVKKQYGNGNANLGFGWFGPVGRLEPTADLFVSYNSAAGGFLGVKIDRVDELTNKAIAELDVAKRKEYDAEINREVLNAYGAGGIHTMVQVLNRLSWNYYKTGEATPFTNTHNSWRENWFDQTDPTWQSRPV